MDPSTSSTLSRFRPAVIACATVAAAGSLYFLYTAYNPTDGYPLGGKLRRRNAIRRSSRNRTSPSSDPTRTSGQERDPDSNAGSTDPTSVAAPPDPDAAHEQPQITNGHVSPEIPILTLGNTGIAGTDGADTDVDEDLEESSTAEGQRLKALAYAIAKHDHEKSGLVHHGVTCDRCNVNPIVGVRYHCANCPDFDLCEDCEALDSHLKTHVFFKVRVPAPWGGKEPLPTWYPGKPHKMPESLENHAAFKTSLSEESGFPMSKIDGLYQQFSCMANTQLLGGNNPFSLGINRAAFNHCFTNQIMTERKAMPSLIQDRLFALFDEDKDGVIDFGEFVMGTSFLHKKRPHKRTRRVFAGLDLDDDGYISRKDCLKIMRSYYELSQQALLGYIMADRIGENAELIARRNEADPASHVLGGRSLASYFANSIAHYARPSEEEGRYQKRLDEAGDYVPVSDDIEAIRDDHDAEDFHSLEEITSGKWKEAQVLFTTECLNIANGTKPDYLVPDEHARTFDADEREIIPSNEIVEVDGKWWVPWSLVADSTVYLRTTKEFMMTQAEDWEEQLSDPQFMDLVARFQELTMLTTTLPELIRQKNEPRVKRLTEYSEFMLDANKSLPGIHVNGQEGADVDYKHPLHDGDFIGGSAATHTIYNVITDALNEMLDSLFLVAEAVTLEAEYTAMERAECDVEVEQHIQDLFNRFWNPKVNTLKSLPDIHTLVKVGTPSEHIQEAKSRIRNGVDPFGEEQKGENIISWTMVRLEEERLQGREFSPLQGNEPNEETKWDYIYFMLRLAAEVWVEDNKLKKPAESKDPDADTETLHFHIEIIAPGYDATMPQNRPSAPPPAVAQPTPPSVSPEANPGPQSKANPSHLDYLAYFEAVDRHVYDRIHDREDLNGGLLNFPEFERLLKGMSEDHRLLLWIEAWLDLVSF